MKYYDPNKFDYLSDEYYEQEKDYTTEYGNNNCYDSNPKSAKTKSTPGARRDYDDLDVKLGIITQRQLDVLETAVDTATPLTGITSIEFDWLWKQTSNAQSQDGKRDKIRVGKLHTRTHIHLMWGFASWQEFSNHLHISDKPQARQLFEEWTAELTLSTSKAGQFKMCYWLVKNNEQRTCPGFWALTVDHLESKTRQIIYCIGNDYGSKDQIDFGKTNLIRIERKQNGKV